MNIFYSKKIDNIYFRHHSKKIFIMSSEYICFFFRKKQFQSLSNFSPHSVTIDDSRKYLTGEHAFHGEKYFLLSQNCTDSQRKNKLLSHSKKFVEPSSYDTAAKAKKAGGKSGLALTKDELSVWDTLNEEVQRKISKFKVEQYPEVKKDLLDTENKILIHPAMRCSLEKLKDRKWEGRMITENGKNKVAGGNKLGQIWMDIRTSLLK